MPKQSGRGDPSGTVSRLWGIQQVPNRGPKHALSSAQVVSAAIAVADADRALTQLSMRRVADSLGVGTMSLYTYVASRDELIEMMLDDVYGEAVSDLQDRTATDWQHGVRAVADANWKLCLRHPWVLEIFTGRPALGPNAIAKYDRELAVIDGIGLTDVEMDAVLTLLLTHVEGVARRRVEADRVIDRTGITDQQWWQQVGPTFAQVFDATRFPLADRVGQAAGHAHQAAHDPEHAYQFGLDRLMEGVTALIASRREVSDLSARAASDGLNPADR